MQPGADCRGSLCLCSTTGSWPTCPPAPVCAARREQAWVSGAWEDTGCLPHISTVVAVLALVPGRPFAVWLLQVGPPPSELWQAQAGISLPAPGAIEPPSPQATLGGCPCPPQAVSLHPRPTALQKSSFARAQANSLSVPGEQGPREQNSCVRSSSVVPFHASVCTHKWTHPRLSPHGPGFPAFLQFNPVCV